MEALFYKFLNMKKIISSIIITLFIFIGLTGCKSDKADKVDNRGVSKSDLSVCGDFPQFSDNGDDADSKYFVCRDINNGKCFYKQSYQSSDEDLVDTYDFDGKLDKKGKSPEDIGKKANCQMTTQEYFESKI